MRVEKIKLCPVNAVNGREEDSKGGGFEGRKIRREDLNGGGPEGRRILREEEEYG